MSPDRPKPKRNNTPAFMRPCVYAFLCLSVYVFERLCVRGVMRSGWSWTLNGTAGSTTQWYGYSRRDGPHRMPQRATLNPGRRAHDQ